MRRNNFTSEECAQIKDSITSLRVKREKIDRKIKTLENEGYDDEEEIS
jgi:hypothetical protein